jgi:2-dehydropantoate 2-reductase
MPIGEPSGERSPRVLELARLLTAAGIKSPVRNNLRNEIWLKLWQNLSFNPISILTNGTIDALAADPGTRRVIHVMMSEARTVAQTLGVNFIVDIEERIEMTVKAGSHRTSMLQDVEAERPTELEALLGVVIELAGLTGISTPCLKLVYDLAKFRSRAV